MFKFFIFVGFLVGIAFVMTPAPEPQRALSANEIPVLNDKPMLTSWGPTLGSLRDGARAGSPSSDASTLVASNDSFGSFKAEMSDPASDGLPEDTIEVAALAGTASAGDGASADKPKPAAAPKRRATTKPAIDRVAAALPEKRRGLFGRRLNQPRAKAPRATRQAQAAQRNRGFFKRLRGRKTQTARASALGPAR
jgi:hypothetical protein